jgi:hypothetical protein
MMYMRVPSIYLETTMFSFYYEERQHGEYQKYKAQARKIFDLIKAGEYEPYTSILALQEIAREHDPVKREKMAALVVKYGVAVLEESDETSRIAALYVQEGAISPAWEADAKHIAMTTVNGLDFIVSLNFTHIARTWTIEHVRRVNAREGYRSIGIYKPAEVLELYEDDTRIHG